MPVDHAEVLRRLKREIASKPSHGQRDLLAAVARLEGECGTDDEQYARFLRRFEVELEEAFLNTLPPIPAGGAATGPLPDAAAPAPAMDGDAAPPIRAAGATKEETCPQTPPRASGSPRPTASRAALRT